jgi:hypothetical protein
MAEIAAARSSPPQLPQRQGFESGQGRGFGVAVERGRGLRPIEEGSRTVYLVTPVTYDGEKADAEEVAQAFDKLVKDATSAGALTDSGVESVGFCVIQASGDEVPLGIELPRKEP